MTQTAVRIPTNPGNPAAATVIESGVRLRADASLTTTVQRTLALYEHITLYPSTTTSVNGYPFAFIHDANGQPGWAATADAGASGATWIKPDTVLQWNVNLTIPYVSQIDANSNASNNDCGISSLLMLIHFWFQQHGLLIPSLPTVNDLEKYTPLAGSNPPSGLTFAQIADLARRAGFPTQFVQPLNNDGIISQLNQRRPVMVLMDYHVYNPSNASIAHILVVNGYNGDSFMTQDPYLRGPNVVVTKATLDAAMRNSPGNSIGYQGLYLNV